MVERGVLLMGNLRSEILFNRALLWLVLAGIAGWYGSMLAIVNLAPCAYNVWKSYEAWGDEA